MAGICALSGRLLLCNTGITSYRSTKEVLVALRVIWCHAIGARNTSGKVSGARYERSQAAPRRTHLTIMLLIVKEEVRDEASRRIANDRSGGADQVLWSAGRYQGRKFPGGIRRDCGLPGAQRRGKDHHNADPYLLLPRVLR